MKTISVELTAEELLLLRQGITLSAQRAYTESIENAVCTPAVNTSLDVKLWRAQKELAK